MVPIANGSSRMNELMTQLTFSDSVYSGEVSYSLGSQQGIQELILWIHGVRRRGLKGGQKCSCQRRRLRRQCSGKGAGERR